MFAGQITFDKDTNTFTGMIHAQKFDIAIALAPIDGMSKNSPTHEITATNRAGRTVRIGSAWDQTSDTTGNRYVSMQMDVGLGAFRVNAVQTTESRKENPTQFDIIPFVSQNTVPSGSMSGKLTAMDADNAFAGYVASMTFDLEFLLIENTYKSDDTHPDYRIEVSSPRGHAIRVGSAWMQISKDGKNEYISLLINTPDGDLRLNAVQNDAQRGTSEFAIIPLIDKAGGHQNRPDLGLVA